MSDLIARCLARFLALLFPARGEHRATLAPIPAPAPSPRPRRPLPPHKSPYAHQASSRRPFVDTISPVRPYVLTPQRRRPKSCAQMAQAERRWALDMALRGHDVGPTRIHGVHVRPGSRTVRVPLAVSA